ncbi:outer membrane protein with beta-barrel domain [Flavobacterium araucananum]|uniref:Outer membrane protein beta-barrel domain-containing protein n=1 Tax=Flavobacterium araucananum TaxID=946678 RepID=A0A227P5X8_9FLAO|nr:porin family protein [Flavobacterium araucananum]OXG04435.1 hypothetical protein B0A64_14660 [Flavobacterium araucananum]PWJ96974.1 outer membrane protein with beta-barrel domain [Flavobacterium araucananum]
MKKIILSAIAVMTFAFVNAQDVKYGVKGGLNLSNFFGDVGDFKLRAGFNAGVFVEVKLSEKFAIQPEVLYSQQGAKFKISGSYFDGPNYNFFRTTFKYNLGYVNVPVMFKYYPVKKFAIEAGPQIGFLVSADGKSKTDDVTTEISIKDFYNTIDFGLNLGAGYDLTENISVGARYNFGLANIAKTEAGDKSKVHNEVLSFSVGYKF